MGRLARAGSGGVSQDPVGAGWAPPGGAGVGSSLASPRPLGPGAGLHLLPPPATSSSPGCHLSRGVSLGQFSPIPHPPLRVSCLGRGWRDISWTVRDPSGEGRGVAAAAQSLPLQVSVWGKWREGRTAIWGSPGQASHHPTCSIPAPESPPPSLL